MIKRSTNLAFIALMSFAIFISSCGTDDPGDDGKIETETGILVLNEGGFQKGNSSLAFIALDSGNVRTKIYEKANDKALGDVGQSFTYHNDLLYVVLNNSKQIKVLDPTNFTELNIIEGLTSPRYMQPVTNNRAYVTDLFANGISVVDLNTNMITNTIGLKGMTEKMAISGDNVYVANNSSNYVYVLDMQSDVVSDSIDIGGKNDEIYALNSNIVVMRNANADDSIKSAFITINPSNHEITNTVEFESSATVWSSTSTKYNNSIYFLHEGAVMVYNANEVSKLFDVTAAAAAYNIYVYDENIFIGDAKDYSSTGAVLQYDMNGNLQNTYSTGIIPSSMMWAEF